MQIKTPPAPEWEALVDARDDEPALRVLLRPVGTTILNAGRRQIREALAQDPQADTVFAFLVGCVHGAGVEWEGLADEAGQPLTRPSIDQLILLLQQNPALYAKFDQGLVTDALELLAEKKGSSPSPNGTSSAAAPATAKPARSPAKRARTASTRSAAKPASGSGTPSATASDS